MPIYDYRCEDCDQRYEVFHKVRENADDVVCPNCSSRRHRKVMSIPAAAVMSSGSAASSSSGECFGGACDNAGGCGCAGGACGLD